VRAVISSVPVGIKYVGDALAIRGIETQARQLEYVDMPACDHLGEGMRDVRRESREVRFDGVANVAGHPNVARVNSRRPRSQQRHSQNGQERAAPEFLSPHPFPH
jgi:hypothetical protein